jgi:hypothetical protein
MTVVAKWTFHCMTERLTCGSGVMSDLMIGTTLRHNPGKLRGKAAARVFLEVVVEITDGVV